MTNKIFPIVVALILVVLLTLLCDPFMLWMPAQAQMAALLLAAAFLSLWAGLVAYESARDEREVLHSMYAGRAAYLSGIAILTVALVVQGFSHAVDPWIAIALGVMVLVKLGARFYTDRYR